MKPVRHIPGFGKGGTGVLSVDGKEVASKAIPHTIPFIAMVDETFDFGVAPKALEDKTGNWLATVPGKGYSVVLRLYGPTEPAINKSWRPSDIEKVK